MTATGRLGWVGHATAVIDVGGFRVVTDPLLRRRVVHLRRRWPTPEPPSVDAVLVSHAHMDHLHLPSLRLLAATTPVVAPAGTRSLLRRAGFRHVVELTEGGVAEIGRATITATHARHPAGRGPHRRIEARPLGYVIDIHGHRTYFAGDTDLFDDMANLGDIDLALLPIWGWGPTIGVGHLDPERAVEAVSRIDPGRVVPIHWGTYAPETLRRGRPRWLAAPAEDFRRRMHHAGRGSVVTMLDPGGVVDLGPRPASRYVPGT